MSQVSQTWHEKRVLNCWICNREPLRNKVHKCCPPGMVTNIGLTECVHRKEGSSPWLLHVNGHRYSDNELYESGKLEFDKSMVCRPAACRNQPWMMSAKVWHSFFPLTWPYLGMIFCIEFMQHPLLHMGLGVPFRVDVICGWTQINLVENYGRSVTVFISGLH